MVKESSPPNILVISIVTGIPSASIITSEEMPIEKDIGTPISNKTIKMANISKIFTVSPLSAQGCPQTL